MTESQKLSVLRDKLIRRRRALVEGIQATAASQLNGDDLVRVQNEIGSGGKGNGRREACRISPLTMHRCRSILSRSSYDWHESRQRRGQCDEPA
jgi:hypothetical protein